MILALAVVAMASCDKSDELPICGDTLEWIELSPDTEDQDPAQGGSGSDGDENENPLG